MTYFGPLGFESAALVAYLEGQPGVETIRPGYNPATWMLEVTGGSMSTTFKSSGQDFPALYAASQLRLDNEAHMDKLVAEGKATHEQLALAGEYAASSSTQRTVLIQKFFMLYWRNPNYSERARERECARARVGAEGVPTLWCVWHQGLTPVPCSPLSPAAPPPAQQTLCGSP